MSEDTRAIQAAIKADTGLDSNVTGSRATKSGTIFLPLSVYKISSTLLYVGDGGHSFGMHGELGSSFGGSYGTTLWWTGSGGTMVELRALIRSAVENVDFGGRLQAQTCVRMHSDQANPKAGGCDGNVFRRCSFLDVAGGASSVAFLVGEV